MKHRSRYTRSSKNLARKRKRQDKFKEFVKKDHQSLEAKYATHGQSNLNFIDTQITTSSYPWDRVTPEQLRLSRKPTKSLKSLRHICAETIASQASKITSDLLRTLPWSIWKIVWTMILATNQDSIQVYILFLCHFGHLPDFKSHKAHIMNVRDETVAFTQIAKNRLHRIETLFSNIAISDMVQELLMSKSYVILDISHQPVMNKEEYFSILNVPNLICLDLSNQDINDTFLQLLGSCISTTTKLNQLVMIKLVNTKVTPQAVLKFLNAISLPSCKLTYIEIDLEMKHKCWKLMNPGQTKIVQTMPMGLSLNGLQRSGTTSNGTTSNVQVSKVPILDIFIAKEQYSQYNMEAIWKCRNKALNSIQKRTTYVYEKSSFVDWPNDEESVEEEKPQRQKKALKTNAQDFFRLS
ncbi:hypothetical protein I9W82_002240 [Candida metapsilosis]|uniref:Uncharacterized protein n=1 Tax=Candida metapsilosis TaxID=273372 RepID=A0A8H7ZHT7_9ASCO|nr:hypothetical protein I9W82_002240 [Candida metapsilosis]